MVTGLLLIVSNNHGVTIEDLKELSQQKPTEKIVYIGINTFFDIRLLKEEAGKVPVSYEKSYAQSLPLFMQKLLRNDNTTDFCKVILIDFAWQTNEKNSFFAEFLKTHPDIKQDKIHYFAPPSLIHIASSRLLGKDWTYLDYLKEYIEKVLDQGGIVAIGAFFDPAKKQKERLEVLDMFNEFQKNKKLKNRIVLLTTAPDPLMIQTIAKTTVAVQVPGCTAFWWNSNAFNIQDEQILYTRVDRHVGAAEYFSIFTPGGAYTAPKKVGLSKPIYRKILYDRPFAQEHFQKAFEQVLTQDANSKVTLQDLMNKKNLACTWVSLIPLPLVSKIAPVLELDIDISDPKQFTFKIPEMAAFDYLNFTPYIEPFRAWKVAADVLESPLISTLKALDSDLTSLWAQTFNY